MREAPVSLPKESILESMMFVCLFLSLALTVTTLMVVSLRRQRRGLQAMVQRAFQRGFYRADED